MDFIKVKLKQGGKFLLLSKKSRSAKAVLLSASTKAKNHKISKKNVVLSFKKDRSGQCREAASLRTYGALKHLKR